MTEKKRIMIYADGKIISVDSDAVLVTLHYLEGTNTVGYKELWIVGPDVEPVKIERDQ